MKTAFDYELREKFVRMAVRNHFFGLHSDCISAQPTSTAASPYDLHFIESITIFPVEAIIFAMAWWFVWKRRHSARFVGIGASLTLLVNTLIAYLQFPHLFWSVRTLAIAALGILGVIAFIVPDQTETPVERF